jgi:hypothetical protein
MDNFALRSFAQRESVDMNNVISRAVRAGTRASSRVMSRPVSASPTCGPTASCPLSLACYLLYLDLLPPACGLLPSCLLPPGLLPPSLVSPVCCLLPSILLPPASQPCLLASCPLFFCLLFGTSVSRDSSKPLRFVAGSVRRGGLAQLNKYPHARNTCTLRNTLSHTHNT